ncbi:MAG: hypothetical protein QXU18_12500, partial [Thermoplasmatales archaeon]
DEQTSNQSKIRMSAVFIRTTVLIYGTTVSVAQFILISLLFSTNLSFFLLLNGVFFGGSILFSVILIFMVVYLVSVSRKLDAEYMTMLNEPQEDGNTSI